MLGKGSELRWVDGVLEITNAQILVGDDCLGYKFWTVFRWDVLTLTIVTLGLVLNFTWMVGARVCCAVGLVRDP